jgi:hypothetical protein
VSDDGKSLAERYKEAMLQHAGVLDDHDRDMMARLDDPIQAQLLTINRTHDVLIVQLQRRRQQRFAEDLTWERLARNMGRFNSTERQVVDAYLQAQEAGTKLPRLPKIIQAKIAELRAEVELYETLAESAPLRWLQRYAVGLGQYITGLDLVDIDDDATWERLNKRFDNI